MRCETVQTGSMTLADLLDRILDKGLVINADILVTLCGVELLGIRIRAALASFETAARYGLEWPSGTQLREPILAVARIQQEPCIDCGRRSDVALLLGDGCPWCGWQRPRRAKELAATAGKPAKAGRK